MLVLLDRDGVINEDRAEGILSVETFKFLPHATQGIALLTKHGFRIAICTNQSAVGRGNLSVETLDAIHRKMIDGVEAAGGAIDRIYYAPDRPEAPSERRKPGPGMLLEALAEFGADPARTPMVGDMLRDLEAAKAAGCPRILVKSGKGAQTLSRGIPAAIEPVVIRTDLLDAAQYICAHYAGA